MRPFTMTMIALMACAAPVATAQAGKQAARPSQAESAASVSCFNWGTGPGGGIVPGQIRCYNDYRECMKARTSFPGTTICWTVRPLVAACGKKAHGNQPYFDQCLRETAPRCFGC
jgi:hypothetical protein